MELQLSVVSPSLATFTFIWLFSQGGKDGIQLLAFDLGGGSGDDVSGNAAQDVSLVSGQTLQHIVEQGLDDGDEGVAVVIAEGSQPVALKTDL